LNPTPGRGGSSSRSLPARTTPRSIIKPTTTVTITPSKSRSRSKSNNHRGGQEEQDDDDDDDPADDDLLTQILASQRTLAIHLRTTQQELELVRQARRIEAASSEEGEGEGGNNDAGLGAMVARWKGASRLAAEELFGLVRGRVDGMGGARAWRESRRPRGWDDGGGCGEGGKGRGDEEGEGEGEGEGCEGEEGEEK
jgi:Swi5-dependent recombination DNA repair protein 1